MTSRSSALKKIERLYGLIETMHATALQQAAALLHEAENAIGVQQDALRDSRMNAHDAMSRGNREDYAMADTERSVGGRRQLRLEELREVRAVATEAARREYDASRVQRGQIKTVVDAAAVAERILADRRAQNVSDDRYLSRLRWTQLQDETI